MNVQDVHGSSLAISTALSGDYVENHIPALDVIRVHNEAGVRYMLVGAYGISGWTRKPRATEDVDVLVAARSHKKALKALLAAFPDLDPEDQDTVTRLRHRESGNIVIDVLKPNQPLFREALKYIHPVQSRGQHYPIPTLELALAMEFARMISLHRALEERYLDAHDFITMVKANTDIDLDQLAMLGEMVYHGGGAEIVEKVRQARAGERLLL
jgi:hypothetical protein